MQALKQRGELQAWDTIPVLTDEELQDLVAQKEAAAQEDAAAPAARQEAPMWMRGRKRPADDSADDSADDTAGGAGGSRKKLRQGAASEPLPAPAASPPSAAAAAPSQAAATPGTGGQQAWWETLDGVYEKLMDYLRLAVPFAKDWEPDNVLRTRIVYELMTAGVPDEFTSADDAQATVKAMGKVLVAELRPPAAATQAGGGGGGEEAQQEAD
jgi:hypothetical protein